MRLKTICLLLFLVSFSYLILHTPYIVQAQDSSASAALQKGLAVTPSIIKLDLSEDPNNFEILYKNQTESDIDLTFSVSDFTELEDGGKVRFLEPKEAANYQFSLASWLDIERQSLRLKPGESAKLKVTIEQDELSPGGHYGTVLANISQADEQGQVGLKGVVSTLVFVRTSTGKEIEDAKVNDFKLSRFALNFPSEANFNFKNDGNVELAPFGLVEITGPFGQKAAKGIVNEPGTVTLPQSVRFFQVSLQKESNFLVPGLYKAKYSIHFGKGNITQTGEVNFFSLGVLESGKTGLAALVLVLLLIWKFRKKSKASE